MSRKTQTYLLIGLVVVLALVFLWERRTTPALVGVTAADSAPYVPLKVEEPTLRVDLLTKAHNLEYSGTHRNIFSNAPPPPPVPKGGNVGPVVPPVPTGPPPVVVPVTFFGYATNPRTGKRQAFFTNGDEVYVIPEGATLLNQFRLLKIGNSTAELEQISDGRRTTVNMEQPPANQQ
jgi:hypothetical protein